jgi:prepilin-type N-terminal cleavage/methylation domain-containing protein
VASQLRLYLGWWQNSEQGLPYSWDQMRHTKHKTGRRTYSNGFTLVELLMALVVSSVVLAAVATLAFALSSANDVTDDTSYKQTQVRAATLRISELLRHCRLICGTPGNELAIWRADDNGDRQININELVYIERGIAKDYLRLCEFPSSDVSVVNLSDIETLSPDGYSVTRVILIPQCSNVEFLVDVAPPQSKFASISFDLAENNTVRHYQINTALRGWAGNLLNQTADSVIGDDD